MTDTSMRWLDLRGRSINVEGQGRRIGSIEDFYYEPATNSINALRVNAGLKGYRILLSSAIAAFNEAGVTVANEQRLIDEANAGPIYHFPLGDSLIGVHMLTEQGEELGTIRNLLLSIYPPIALHIAAFELQGGSRSFIEANEITSFGDTQVTVLR